TLAPRRPSALAIAKPIPVAPPVTTAVLPVRSSASMHGSLPGGSPHDTSSGRGKLPLHPTAGAAGAAQGRAGLVPTLRPGPAVAPDPRPLPHLGERDHAPADAGGGRAAVLAALPRTLSHGGGAGERARGRGARGLERARLLRACAIAAPRREGGGRAPRRNLARRRRRPRAAPRLRSVHRGGRRLDRLRPAARRGRRQHRPGAGALALPRGRSARGCATGAAAARGGGLPPARARRRLEPGADGARRHDLRPQPRLPRLPRAGALPRPAAGTAGGDPA